MLLYCTRNLLEDVHTVVGEGDVSQHSACPASCKQLTDMPQGREGWGGEGGGDSGW